MALRVALQTIWMVFVAHALGPQGYGFLAGIAALATTLGTFTGFGFGVLLLQDASRKIETFPMAWRKAMAMAVISGTILCLGYAAIAPHVFGMHEGNSVYLAVAVAELLCFPVIAIASFAFQAHERMGWAGLLYATIPTGNLIAFILFSWWSPTRSLTDYLQFHAAMAIVAALVSVAMVHCILSPTRADCVPTLRDIREGAGFSIMRVADTALNALDKTVVLHLAGNHSAGIYSAAYRLISVASLPLVSLSMSVLPRLFRAGTGGIAATPLVRGLLAAVLAYGIFAGMVVWSIAGLLPVLLGEGFRPTVEVARWLAISPLLQGLYIIGANLLVTQNMVGLRVIAQSLTIGVMVFSAIFLIPAFGLAGAAGMLLVTQAFAAILIWSCYALGRRQMIRRDLTTQETQGVEGSSPPAP